ncbi:MAG: hypothetical protein U1F27_15340 [Turneriella sp.]
MLKDLKHVHHRLPWFGLWRIRRRINKVTKKLFNRLRKDSKSLIEYGNLRRGKPWGLKEGNTVVWSYLVDLLADRPLIYKIVYDIGAARYTCYSRSGGRNEMANVLQFTSDDLDELVARLNTLAAEIPAMRERMLRQHLYALKAKKIRGAGSTCSAGAALKKICSHWRRCARLFRQCSLREKYPRTKP